MSYKKEYELKLDTILLEIRKLCLDSDVSTSNLFDINKCIYSLFSAIDYDDFPVIKKSGLKATQLIINQIIEKC